MSENGHFKFSKTTLIVPLCAMLVIWVVYWIEIAFAVNYNDFGIMPRTALGLRGVFLSPFIHGSLEHLYNNTIPLGMLLAGLWYFYRGIAWKILLYGILLSGLLTWAIGRTSYHIGASGVIYVLASFIFFKGILSTYFRAIALSLVVVFIYGSLLWYIFPVKDGISWEGHLAGFLTGLGLALGVRAKFPNPPKFDWERDDFKEEEDPFLRHFDEDGNFIEFPDKEEDVEESDMNIKYFYKKSEQKDM